MASPLSKDLNYLIMQYLSEENCKEALHKLEQESGLFFNMKHFEELVLTGNWAETDKYLSGFTRVSDNRFSVKIYFELRKQNYLEALDMDDRVKAIDILKKDLKVFAAYDEGLFRDMTQLLLLDNFRENDQLARYTDTCAARVNLLAELKKLIAANPILCDKLQFPTIKASRLYTLINHSLHWQHSLCPNPRKNPDMRTLYEDHSCRNSNNLVPELVLGSPATRSDGSFLAIRASGSPLAAHLTASNTAGLNVLANTAAISKAPGDSSARTLLVANSPSQTIPAASTWAEEFPRSVTRVLTQGSSPTSMDFHPIQQTLLLVGTNLGEISLWEVSSTEMLAWRSFQMGFVKDKSIAVKKILWTDDGSLFGAAFSKNAVQLYHYKGGNDIRKYLEFEAHSGSVNDLAFSNLTKKLCVITCGDDKLVKVWDVATGSMMYAYEGHTSPVFSVCPYTKENVHYLYSASVDGKIKAWMYDTGRTVVDWEAPGRLCTALACTVDGKRLFSCGTSKEGESHVVEWNEADGTVKRAYRGLVRQFSSCVQFDIAKNKFLAVGAFDCSIKVWVIDSANMVAVVDADGDLRAYPRIRFNKDGSLLAVSAKDNKIKILTTVDELCLMHTHENRTFMPPRLVPETRTQGGVVRKPEEANPARIWKLPEISEPSQLRSLWLKSSVKVEKISRLLFNNSGNYILALTLNGVHLIWKWGRSDQNVSGKATTMVAPELSQATSGRLMTNDLANVKVDDGLCCIALSKNGSYIISASGGKISLFSMSSSKAMTTFMAPPPSATCLAFHPRDNNVFAVGMDDSTIHIYNVQTDKLMTKLGGHSKRITGLAFSNSLKTLVSSGADSQIVSWNSESWERQRSIYLNIPGVKTAAAMSNTTQVQFHRDQTRFLVAHEVQLSIHEATRLECTKQWVAGDSSPPISQATFSSDSRQVYVIFMDGTICVFGAVNLQPRCLINPAAYLPSNIMSGRVVAAHPQEANMVAVGLSDGGVVVLEPLESETKWGVPPPAATTAGAAALEAQPMTIG